MIKRNPTSFQYYKFRGTVYEDKGNDVLAKADFVRAVELCDTDSTALFRLGMVYQRGGDLQSAIKYLEMANSRIDTYDKLMGDTYNNILFVHKRVIAANLANFLSQVNRINEALRILDEVIINCTDYAYPYFVKSIILANKKEYADALALAEKARSLGHAQANALISQLKTKISVTGTPDRYSKMVECATFNPFNITTNPSLQNTNPLPDLTEVFQRELSNSFRMLRGRMDDLTIVSSYIFNLAESYYNNAGYIPKNTLDEIIESVYKALKQTQYSDAVSNIEDLKYKLYYSLLNR